MTISKSSRITILRPELLSLTLGLCWAIFVFIMTLVAIASGESGALIRLWEAIYPWYRATPVGLILGVLWGFINGYLLGFFIGWIYHWLLKAKVESVQEDLFELNAAEKVNIIQDGSGDNPYTIVFVANPAIKKTNSTFEQDPIIVDNELFFRIVVRSIRSFMNNELLRLPEIFKRLRILTVFDDTRRALTNENALCEEVVGEIDILAPRGNLSIIKNYLQPLGIEYSDVVVAISASDTLIRSAARFTEDEAAGEDFEFTFSPDLSVVTRRKHAYYAQLPGVVALSAWDDRLKTPVHEFAHAMSSRENGAIIDEYVDRYEEPSERHLQFIINRRRRGDPNLPIPDLFAKYGLVGKGLREYSSDRYRSDKEPGWSSYVPERSDPGLSCIMDVAYFGYQFDGLLFDFMYDRLLAKLNRPPRP